MGEWFWETEVVENMVTKHFKDLFTSSHSVSFLNTSCNNRFIRSLDHESCSFLDWTPSLQDIKDALFFLKAFKAPGPDGFHPIFFQKCWETIHKSILYMILKVFQFESIDSRLNATLICLIAKVSNSETINQYRPISLCNTSYKIITKLIVIRMRSLLPNLTSLFQSSFVPGRRASDNIIIMQEMVHTMRKKKGNKGVMDIKIELEKAYDSMEWSFVRKVLLPFKFGERFGMASTAAGEEVFVFYRGGGEVVYGSGGGFLDDLGHHFWCFQGGLVMFSDKLERERGERRHSSGEEA